MKSIKTDQIIEQAKAEIKANGWNIDEANCSCSAGREADLVHLVCISKVYPYLHQFMPVRKGFGPLPRIYAYSEAYQSITGKDILTLLREDH